MTIKYAACVIPILKGEEKFEWQGERGREEKKYKEKLDRNIDILLQISNNREESMDILGNPKITQVVSKNVHLLD